MSDVSGERERKASTHASMSSAFSCFFFILDFKSVAYRLARHSDGSWIAAFYTFSLSVKNRREEQSICLRL